MKWIVLIVLSSATGLGAWAWHEEWPPFEDFEIPAFTGTAPPSESPEPPTERAPRLVYASGVVEGTTREIELRFELEGRLTHLEVDEGQTVTEGEVLARLDDSVVRSEVARARANLALAEAKRVRLLNGTREETRSVAEAEVAVAEIEASLARIRKGRVAKLRAREAATESAWDDADHAAQLAQSQLQLARARADEVAADARADELAIADAEIALAEAELGLAETRLAKTRLTAPCDGVVLRRDVEAGHLVGPESPLPTLRMTNVDEIRVRAFVEEYDAPRIEQGQRAWIATEAEPDQRIPGTVIHASPGMSAKQLRTDRPGERFDVKVREILVRVQEPEELVLGLPVDVYVDPDPTSPVPVDDELQDYEVQPWATDGNDGERAMTSIAAPRASEVEN